MGRWDKLKDVHDWYAQAAASMIAAGSAVIPSVMVLGQGKDPGSLQCIPLTSTASEALFSASDDRPLLSLATSIVTGKGLDADAFRRTAGLSPWGLLVLSQAWVVAGYSASAGRTSMALQPSSLQEALILTFHVPFGSRSFVHPIVDAPRRCELVPFPPSDSPPVLVRHINIGKDTPSSVVH